MLALTRTLSRVLGLTTSLLSPRPFPCRLTAGIPPVVAAVVTAVVPLRGTRPGEGQSEMAGTAAPTSSIGTAMAMRMRHHRRTAMTSRGERASVCVIVVDCRRLFLFFSFSFHVDTTTITITATLVLVAVAAVAWARPRA